MITDNERRALEAIINSEYQDGGNPVGNDVWTQYCNPFANKKTQSGVYASLSKKGFIKVDDMDGMGTVCITQAGFDTWQAA